MRSVNVYLVRDRDGYVLVDCGLDVPEAWSALADQLAVLGVSIKALHTVVVTHGHLDHYGLGPRLRDHSGAQVWLHTRDVEFMHWRHADGPRYRALLVTWLVRYGFPEAEAAQVAQSVEQAWGEKLLIPPERLLEGGETLVIGPYRFEILWTPGHTPGHVCLYEPHQGLLLSGDHILPRVAPNVSLQPYTTHNPLPGYRDSLRRFAAMPVQLALPGHGEPFNDLAGRASQLLAHQEERRAQVLGLLTCQPQTAYQLAGQVWAETTPLNWSQFRGMLRRNAIGTLAAHLEQLADEGMVDRSEDQAVRFARLT